MSTFKHHQRIFFVLERGRKARPYPNVHDKFSATQNRLLRLWERPTLHECSKHDSAVHHFSRQTPSLGNGRSGAECIFDGSGGNEESERIDANSSSLRPDVSVQRSPGRKGGLD